jgi:hypothetical protein
MTPFLNLFQNYRDRMPGEQQALIVQEFPEVVARFGFERWSATAGPGSGADRLVLGVATYSIYDMRLLDLVVNARQNWTTPRIEVFNTLDCKSVDDLEARIPGIGMAYQTPVAGLWRGGVLREKGWGLPARELVARECGFDLRELNLSPTEPTTANSTHATRRP